MQVIDEDLGRSGTTGTAHGGFRELVADVGLGKVGIVLGIEVSRLAPTHRLVSAVGPVPAHQHVDLPTRTGCIPAEINDRLVLGLNGTRSEAEPHFIRSRLTAGLHHKAAKGELHQGLPVGFDHDPDGQIAVCADEAVREAITSVFDRFAELGGGPAGGQARCAPTSRSRS